MFDKIIAYSVRNKLLVGLFVLALIAWGLFSLRQIPIDAVPDITNNQVQVITSSPTLATQEIEQFVTTPGRARPAKFAGPRRNPLHLPLRAFRCHRRVRGKH